MYPASILILAQVLSHSFSLFELELSAIDRFSSNVTKCHHSLWVWNRHPCKATSLLCQDDLLSSACGTQVLRFSYNISLPNNEKDWDGCWCALLILCILKKLFSPTTKGSKVCDLQITLRSILYDWELLVNHLHWLRRVFCRQEDRHLQCILLNQPRYCSQKVAIRFRWWDCEVILIPFRYAEYHLTL